MLYAVCTSCAFLRAFARGATPPPASTACPACGGELMLRGSAGRYQPTYVSRTRLELHQTPPLDLERGGLAPDTAA